MNNKERVLVVAAHPDDEVLGCGGTIARYRDSGAAVRVLFLAEGVTARFEQHQFNDPKVVAWSRRRNENALKALARLGMAADDVFLGSRPCCRLDQVALIDLTKEIERHIRDFRPTRIFSHATDDPNVDHGLAHRALLPAIRPLTGNYLKAAFAFEVLSSTEWNPLKPFAPTNFIDISQTIDRKVRAMADYDDEMLPSPHPRSPESLLALARYRGVQAGLAFAEGFALIRGIDL